MFLAAVCDSPADGERDDEVMPLTESDRTRPPVGRRAGGASRSVQPHDIAHRDVRQANREGAIREDVAYRAAIVPASAHQVVQWRCSRAEAVSSLSTHPDHPEEEE